MPNIHKGTGDSARANHIEEHLASADCPNSDHFCESAVGSESEEDISEVESFILAEGDDEAMLSDECVATAVGNIEGAVNNNYLLSDAHSSIRSTLGKFYRLGELQGGQSAEAQFDTDTQARLVALIEAAGKIEVASSTDPEVLRRLTNSVSSALDEAASTLARMRAEAAGNSASIAARNFPALPAGANIGSSSSSGGSHYSSSINTSTSSSNSSTSRSSSRDSTPERRPKKILVAAVSEGDIPTVERILQNGGNVHETTEEGDSILTLACSAGYLELAQVLISMRANIEDRGEKGDCTPIMEAASAGHCEIIQLLLSHNASINAQSSNGSTPLMYATLGGHLDAINLLISKGANLEIQNETGHSALMEASSGSYINIARLLLQKGANVNACSVEFKESALTLACYKGHYEMVKFLLDNGADMEHKTDEMHTPLMEACMDGHLEVTRILLDYGAIIDMPADSFESPLTLACCGGHTDLVLLMLERGANIEEPNDEGYTPLMEASREGHEEIISILIANGCDINALTEDTQETALCLASCGGFKEVVELMVRSEADFELGATTPLMEAAQEGHREIAEFLVACGANVNAQTPTGDTALTYACENGHTDVAELLLQANANLEHLSEGGRTPLMKAARSGHFCSVQYLLMRGANVQRSTLDNEHTALSLACAGGHTRVVDLLLLNGANPFHRLKDNSTMVMEAAKGGHMDVVTTLVDFPAAVDAMKKAIEDGKNQQINAANQLAMEITGMPEGHDYMAIDPSQMLMSENSMQSSDVISLGGGIGSYPISYTRPKDMLQMPHLKAISKNDAFVDMEQAYHSPQHNVHLGDMAGVMASALCHDDNILSSSGSSSRSGSVYLSPTSSLPEGFASSQPMANIPVQERRKLVPSKKTLDKKILQHKLGVQKHLTSSSLASNQTNFNYLGGALSPSEIFNNHAYSLGDMSQIPSIVTPPKGLIPQGWESPNNIGKSEMRAVQHRECGCGLTHDEQPVDMVANFEGSNDALATAQIVSTMENMSLQGAAPELGSMQFPHYTMKQELAYNMANLPVLSQYISGSAAISSVMRPVKKTDIMPDRISPKHNSASQDPRNVLSSMEKMTLPYKRQLSGTNIRKSKHVPNEELIETRQKRDQMSREVVEQHQAANYPSLKHSVQSHNLFNITNDAPSGYSVPSNEQSLISSSVFKAAYKLGRELQPSGMEGVNLVQLQEENASEYTDDNGKTKNNSMDINCETDSNKDTALTLAATGGHDNLVKLLLSRGANIEHCDKKGYTPLMLAASAGSVEIVRYLLLKSANTEAQAERSKDTAISLACSNGRCEVVEALLNKGANKEHRNVSDYTPLSIAASNGFYSIVKTLLKNGAEINARTGSKLGISPLMLASMNGNVPCVKVLLEKSADVNAQIETNRNTALTLASFQGRNEVVSLLIDKTANLEHRAKTGLTPLMEAASGGHFEVGRVLLRKGADVNASPVPVSRDTALTIAADKGHLKFVILLIDAGALIEAKNKKGNTPLWLSCSNGHFEVVRALLKGGANIDSADNRKVSCLTAAFKKGHLELVKYMIGMVSQLPSDSEMKRHLHTLASKDKESKELRENCTACFEVIKVVKDKKTQTADQHASDLLEMVYSHDKKIKENRKRKDQRNKLKDKKKKNKQDTKKDMKKVMVERDKEEEVEVEEPPAAIPENIPQEDEVLEEKDGDSGIDSNSQTSGTSDPKNLEENSTKKKKKRKNQTAKEDEAVVVPVEEPTPPSPPSPPPPPVKIVEKKKISKEINKRVEKPQRSGQGSKGNSDVKAPRVAEYCPSREKKPVDISSLFDMKIVGAKKKTTVPYYSGMNALDTFGEVEGVSASRPISTNVPSSSAKPVGSNQKKMSWREEEWKEVVRKAKKVSVPSNAISRVIGRGGGNINMIREVSGAHIEVEKQGKGHGDRMVIIKGSTEATKQAHNLINALVNEPDKDLSELLPKSYVKSSKMRSTYENSYSTKVIRSNNQTVDGAGKNNSLHPNLSSPKRTTVTQHVSQAVKSPIVRQLFPPSCSKLNSNQVVETQTFASKVADTAPRTTSNRKDLVNGNVTEGRGAERSQYSIFNNPLSEATQEVAFGGPKERKSFARAASGAIAAKQPLAQPAPLTVVNKITDTVEKQPEVDRRRAPGYRDMKPFIPVPLLERAEPDKFKVVQIPKIPAGFPILPDYKHTGINVNTMVPSSRQLPVHPPTNVIPQLQATPSGIAAPVSVPPLARSAPGTPVASPSMRPITPHTIRQTVTPPPSKSTLDFPPTFNPVVGGSKTPPATMNNAATNQSVHAIRNNPDGTHNQITNFPGAVYPASGMAMSNLAPGAPQQDRNLPPGALVASQQDRNLAPGALVASQQERNLAPGAPVASQQERNFSNYAVGQPFRNNPTLAELSLHHQQQGAGSMVSQHQSAGQSLHQVLSNQNQYSQQLHQIQQLAPPAGGQVYNSNVANLAQMMNSLRQSAPQTNCQSVFTNVMTPITATPLHSNLNPNAPQFLSRGEPILTQQASRQPHITGMPNYMPNAGGIIPGLHLNQFPPNVAFDSGIQIPSNIDVMANMLQQPRGGNVSATGPYRNAANFTNPEVSADPHSANVSPTQPPTAAINVALPGYGADDRHVVKLQPIGTERAQKRERIVGPQLAPPPMNVIGNEQTWPHPPELQSVAHLNSAPLDQMMAAQHVYYAQSPPDVNAYNHQPLWHWGPDMN